MTQQQQVYERHSAWCTYSVRREDWMRSDGLVVGVRKVYDTDKPRRYDFFIAQAEVYASGLPVAKSPSSVLPPLQPLSLMAQDLYQRLVDVIEKLSIAGYGSPESIEKMRTRPDVDFNGFVANSLTTKVKAEEVTKLLDRVDKLVPLRTTAVAPSVATVSVEDRIRQLEEQVATLMQKLGAAQ